MKPSIPDRWTDEELQAMCPDALSTQEIDDGLELALTLFINDREGMIERMSSMPPDSRAIMIDELDAKAAFRASGLL